MATLTKSTGTVTLAGAVEKVTLPAAYGWVWLKNMSDSDMFAGLSADISEGADGVMVIPSGECGRIQTDGFDFVYLLGTGNALVVAQNYADCPFKAGGKGGEIPDLSAYAKKADVPTNVSQLENDSGYLTKHPVIVPEAGTAIANILNFGGYFDCITDIKKDENGHILALYSRRNTLPNIPTEYAKKTDIPTNVSQFENDSGYLSDRRVIQFIPYNMKYFALNDRLLLFSNDDDVTRGIYFVNNTPNEITVCALILASAEGPAVQYGYGSNTYPEIQNTGDGREWFTEEPIPTSPTIFAMTVPSGKLGYYGVYHNSGSTYTTIHDVRCPYFNFF